MKRVPTVLAAVAFMGLGCATVSQEKLTSTEATARAAEEGGAREHPKASFHLELAEEQLAAAKKLIDGNNREVAQAERYLERAKADAELALAYAHTAEARAKAQAAWAEVDGLQKGTP